MAKPKITDATLSPYAAALNHWPKACGEPPAANLLAAVHAHNIRPGKHALANAMYLRDAGATDAQVRAAAQKLDTRGGNQGVLHNYRRQLEADGFIRRDMNAPRGVYKTVLTKKGEAQVARYSKLTAAKTETAAPVTKPKAKRQRKAKRTVTLPLTGVEVSVTEPVNTEGLFDTSVPTE